MPQRSDVLGLLNVGGLGLFCIKLTPHFLKKKKKRSTQVLLAWTQRRLLTISLDIECYVLENVPLPGVII